MEQARGNRETFSEEDIRFHLAIAEASRNVIYATILRGLEKRCIDYANTNRGDDSWYDRVIETHGQILGAIRDGSADRAAEAMRRHLLLSRRHYIDLEERG